MATGDSVDEAPVTPTPTRIDRRQLFARAAAVAAAAGLAPSAWTALVRAARGLATSAEAGREDGGAVLTAAEWKSMEAVQETLWPAGDGVPGARDVNATGVLDATLADEDFPPQRLVRVRAGLVEVEALARAKGATGFASLDVAEREAVLVAWRERPAGSAWLRTVLAATLEAVLGDPVHGGNPGDVGWRWAGFVPGEPRARARRR